jgi:hypothetical protein
MKRFCQVLLLVAAFTAAGCKKKEDEPKAADPKSAPEATPKAIEHGKGQGKGTGGGEKTATGTRDSKPGSGKPAGDPAPMVEHGKGQGKGTGGGEKTATGTRDSKPGSGKPAAAVTYCGADPCPCVAGSESKQADKLSICDLEKEVDVQGVRCTPGRIVFHDDGTLEECLVAAEASYDGIPCRPAPNATSWHANRKLRGCVLPANHTVGAFAVAEHSSIGLFDDGSVRSAWNLTAPATIDGFECARGVYMFRSGKLEACTLASAAKVGDQELPAGSFFRITEDGKLRGVELGADGTLAGKKAKKGDRTCIGEDGKPDDSSSCWMF